MATTHGASSPSARLNTPETSPDTQQSETSQVVHTSAEINRNMNKMSNVLDDIWQQSQDKHSPLQQSDVEEPRRSTNKRSRSVSPSPSAYGDDDNYQQWKGEIT